MKNKIQVPICVCIHSSIHIGLSLYQPSWITVTNVFKHYSSPSCSFLWPSFPFFLSPLCFSLLICTIQQYLYLTSLAFYSFCSPDAHVGTQSYLIIYFLNVLSISLAFILHKNLKVWI